MNRAVLYAIVFLMVGVELGFYGFVLFVLIVHTKMQGFRRALIYVFTIAYRESHQAQRKLLKIRNFKYPIL